MNRQNLKILSFSFSTEEINAGSFKMKQNRFDIDQNRKIFPSIFSSNQRKRINVRIFQAKYVATFFVLSILTTSVVRTLPWFSSHFNRLHQVDYWKFINKRTITSFLLSNNQLSKGKERFCSILFFIEQKNIWISSKLLLFRKLVFLKWEVQVEKCCFTMIIFVPDK